MSESRLDKVAAGASLVARVLVSLLWGAGGVVCFASGAWPAGLIAIAYLAYLWLFGGRWLIY
jgi:hypothetical protein